MEVNPNENLDNFLDKPFIIKIGSLCDLLLPTSDALHCSEVKHVTCMVLVFSFAGQEGDTLAVFRWGEKLGEKIALVTVALFVCLW